MDYPFHHPWRRAAVLRRSHQPVARFCCFVRADHLLLYRCIFDSAHPLPTTRDLAAMPWWAVVGGLVGALQVYAGLTLVNKIGAGPLMGFTVTAALITSLLIEHFGWLRMQQHPPKALRVIGGVLLVGGVTLIAKF